MNKLIVLRRSIALAAIALFMTSVLPTTPQAADKLPAERAGEIGKPTGKIAFIRGGNVWVSNPDGSQPAMISEVLNADGRLSWSPDNKRIAFTRSGEVSVKSPDNLGGKHKVYDVFLAFLDSAATGNTFWWYRLTDDLGSRDPEWSTDGSTIYFTKDMNSNTVNAILPNYQLCSMDDDGGSFTILRKDWQNMTHYTINPSVSSSGKVATVMLDTKEGPIGIATFDRAKPMVPVDTLLARAKAMRGKVAPCWSPDGKWLAYVNNSITESGLFVTTPSLSEHFLVYEPSVGATLSTRTPSWSPDSKWLTFGTTDGSIWIADITGNGARRISGPGTDSAPAWSK